MSNTKLFILACLLVSGLLRAGSETANTALHEELLPAIIVHVDLEDEAFSVNGVAHSSIPTLVADVDQTAKRFNHTLPIHLVIPPDTPIGKLVELFGAVRLMTRATLRVYITDNFSFEKYPMFATERFFEIMPLKNMDSENQSPRGNESASGLVDQASP